MTRTDFSSEEIDPLVEQLTVERLLSNVAVYESILNAKQTESKVHEFLANHSYFFNTLIRLWGHSPLYSKVKLGHDYEVDFAYFDTSSYGPEWELIEIESPKHRMFNKSGDPSAALIHAIQQVENWHAWIGQNLSYAQQLMPSIQYPMGYVFIGRRADLSISDANRLKRLNYTHRKSIEIRTLDYFIDGAMSVFNLVEEKKRGSWPLPMKAKSHSELSAGLPEPALAFMQDWKSSRLRKRGQREMLKERVNRTLVGD